MIYLYIFQIFEKMPPHYYAGGLNQSTLRHVSKRKYPIQKGEGIIILYLKDKICLIYALAGKNGQTIGITIMETIRQTATSPVPALT